MFGPVDTRAIVSIFFHRLTRFLIVFVGINLLLLTFLLTVQPLYQTNAKLLIKFGQDARPEISSGNNSMTAEEKRGLVQSNLNILTSRDLAAALLKDITLEKAYPEILAKPPKHGTPMDAALKELASQLNTQTQSDAATIHISLRHPDAAIATQMLRRLIDLFLQRQLEIYNNPQTGFINQQAASTGLKLANANRLLGEFQAKVGIASIDEELTLLLRQRSELEGYIARRQNEGGDPAPSQAVPARLPQPSEGSKFPVLDDIQAELAKLRAKEAELLQTYRADSDVVKAVRRSINKQEQILNNTVGVLGGQIAELDQKIATMRTNKATYDDLNRQVKMAEEDYQTAQQRLHAAESNDDLNRQKITSFSVIEQPSVPYRPAYPNKMLVAALGLIISGFFAVLTVLLSELLDPTFSRSEQVRGQLGIPLLGSFGYSRRHKQLGLGARELLGLSQSLSAQLSEVRNPVVSVCSCTKGEGVHSVSLDLAKLCATTLQQRVLLVTTGTAVKEGISLLDIALGHARAADVFTEQQLIALPLSRPDQAQLVLPNIEKLREVLAASRTGFDLVLLALPNVVDNPANAALNRLADGSVMVIAAEQTRLPVIKQAVSLLQESGVRLLGSVLNKQRYYIPGWVYRRL